MGSRPAPDHRPAGSRPAQILTRPLGHAARPFLRAWHLLRPEGSPDVPAGIAAGSSIVLPLLAGTALGETPFGAAMTLATALMLYPAPFRLAPLMLVRIVAVTSAGVFAWLTTGHPWVLAAGVTAAAVAGALWPILGTTAALAALFVAIMDDTGVSGAWITQLPGAAQLAGALWGAAVVLMLGRLSATGRPPEPAPRRRRHAARLGLLIGASMSLMAVLGLRVAEGHWLVTSILNTLQPTQEATGTRYAKRLLGNVLGSALTALILLGHPSALVTALCVGGAGVLAHTYRAANYTYWSIWMPMMLLLLSDFSHPEPWDASLLKMAMNAAGGLAAVLAARWLWPAPSRTAYAQVEEGKET